VNASTVKVIYGGRYEHPIGRACEDLSLPENTLSVTELILQVLGPGNRGNGRVVSEESMHDALMVVLNGRQLTRQECTSTLVRSGDEIMLLEPITGG